MSLLNTAVNLLMAPPPGAAGYSISRSLRFNSSDSAFCSRTPSSAGNRRTWTLSLWVKRSGLGAYQRIFNSRNPGVAADYIRFNNDDTLELYLGAALITTQVFRDPSSWYHLVIAVDTTQATSGNRVKLYVNGSQVSTFGTANYPSQNADTLFNATLIHTLGTGDGTTEYFSGYLANVEFVDGQQLTSSSFTEVSATTGQLIPKQYTGSFGTNGFWLQFADNSNNTATTLGKDTSGNNNNWDCFNLQTTTGGPTSVAAASGALPIYNTTDTYGATKGTGTRTDSNSSSIVLALPMDGANNGTTFTDESATIKGSGSAKTVTANGNAKTVTSQSKYYGSSGAFDGGDDYLLASASADFQFGSGNFTIETWFYPNTAARMALYHGSFGTDWSIGIDFSNITQTIAIWASSTGTNWNLADGDSAGNRGSTVLVTGRWHHVAMVRNGATLQLYVNGILDKQFTGISGSIVDRSSSQPSIGTWFGGQYDLNGYLQDFRIYKGVAKYTGNFNPPSSTQNATVAAGNDSLVDTPTSFGSDTGVGGEVRGNYAVLLDQYVTDKTRLTMANGNLDVTFNNSGSSSSALSSIGVSSGKWYSEFTCTQTGSNYAFVGIASPKNNNIDSLGYGDSYAYVSNTGNKANNGSFVSYGATWTANDVIGVALDLDAGTITFYKNGVSQGQAYSSISGTYIIGCTGFLNWKFSANFGQRPFAYTAPSGFKALCDTNLPAPVVAKPNTVFNVITYTGTGANATIPNVNTVPTSIDFTPDLVWIKGRSGATDHALYDSVRDVQKDLVSNSTAAETTQSTGLTAFGTNTFNIGTLAKLNTSSSTYVGWCWDAGSSTVTNTAGSITSSVRANASAGFSIVRWDSTTLPKTVGHGLGAEPHLIIDKCINNVGSWTVYHKSLGNSAYLRLNTTDAQTTGATIWNSTTPTSTVFHVNDAGWWGGSGFNHVAYCFAPVAGYSSFGSYVGNGSADGPFIYTGFRPKFILVKNTSVAGAWEIYDSVRNPYNVMALTLLPNASDAEITASNGVRIDFTSNGFKWRDNGSSINGSGNTIIWAAFAESPFQYARAR